MPILRKFYENRICRVLSRLVFANSVAQFLPLVAFVSLSYDYLPTGTTLVSSNLSSQNTFGHLGLKFDFSAASIHSRSHDLHFRGPRGAFAFRGAHVEHYRRHARRVNGPKVRQCPKERRPSSSGWTHID